MRAAYANGVLAAFEEAGFRDVDAVYGASAGAALAAWWAAGQARFAVHTWDYIQDRRLLSYRRFLTRRGPLLDHDAMVRIVYQEERQMDIAAIRRFPIPIIAVLSDADTGTPVYRDLRTGPTIDLLRGTARLPLATGDAVRIDGHRYVDGGVLDPIPIRRAIDDGAKDIILILNRPPGKRRPEPALFRRMLAARYPALAEAGNRHHELHDDAVALALHPPKGVRVAIIRPAHDLRVGRLTRNLARIHGAAEAGRQDGAAFLANGAAKLGTTGTRARN